MQAAARQFRVQVNAVSWHTIGKQGYIMSPVSGSDAPPPNADVKLTYDDFLLFPEDGKRHELIDGEHYVTPAPNRKHQTVALNLAAMMWNHLREHPDGRVFVAPFDVVFSQFDVVEPDVLFVSRARQAGVLTAKNVQGGGSRGR